MNARFPIGFNFALTRYRMRRRHDSQPKRHKSTQTAASKAGKLFTVSTSHRIVAVKTDTHVPADKARPYTTALLAAALIAAACSSQNGAQSLTSAQCREMGGTIVGDPGDGRVHDPDFLCESGRPPLGPIEFLEGEPIPVEGAVCCLQFR